MQRSRGIWIVLGVLAAFALPANASAQWSSLSSYYCSVGGFTCDQQQSSFTTDYSSLGGWFEDLLQEYDLEEWLARIGEEFDYEGGNLSAYLCRINSTCTEVSVPEPSSGLLAGIGLFGILLLGVRRKREV